MPSKPRILFLHRQASAVGYYRHVLPARSLRAAGFDVTDFGLTSRDKACKPDLNTWTGENLNKFDLIVTDRCCRDRELANVSGLRHYSEGSRLIVDFDDDFLNVPWWNQSHRSYFPGQPFRDVSLMHLRMAEMATVSTEALLKRFAPRAHAIRVARNLIDPTDWEGRRVGPDRAHDPAVRVLYGGASGHYGDLDAARGGLEPVLLNPPVPMRLVCIGAIPGWVHELEREYPKRIVNLPWAKFEGYADIVKWGGFDIAIAPLEKHPFNETKSNIKWLEAGLQDMAFLCSDVGPYAEIPDECVVKVSNTPLQWAEGLRNLLIDAGLRRRLTQRSREAILDSWTTLGQAQVWSEIVEAAMDRPRIESLDDTALPGDTEVTPEPANEQHSDGSPTVE